MDKTIGEQLVRVNFNVTNDNLVNELKVKSAELINLVESIPVIAKSADNIDPKYVQSWKDDAIKDIQVACMNAVKAATAYL